jgi:hypothetical protein
MLLIQKPRPRRDGGIENPAIAADDSPDPSIVVNVTGENRASYARRAGSRDERLALAQDATSADVDVELKLVGATSESLRITGTIRCLAPLVTE